MEGLGDLPIFPEAVPWEEAQAELEYHALGDGLPLVPPTRQRLEAMLAGVAAPHKSLGQVPSLLGELTATAVAYNCVLAGCQAADLAVVLTAAEACLEPCFNLLGLLTTTGTPAVVTMVHGALAQSLAMNAGSNCLGPGNRGNATIGRAVALVMRNIGGARPGIGDMATMGQPGKYTFCFAEGDDGGLPPFPLRRGFEVDTAALTVLGVSGTVEVLPAGRGETPEEILQPMASAMAFAGAVSDGGRQREPGEQFFLLPPELARQIAKRGWDLAGIQEYLHGARCNARSPQHIHPIVTGGAGVKMTYLPLWAGGTLSVTRAVRDLLL